MNYLFSKLPEVLPKGIEHAKEGEPVIPAFPIETTINKFIGLDTFKYSYHAVVNSVTGDTLQFVNTLVVKLINQYPGIPKKIHEEYVMATAREASKLPRNTVVQIFITDDSATLKVHNAEQLCILWNKQPKE